MKLFQIGFLSLTLVDLIDISLVTWIFYKVYQYFKETRAGQMLIGLVILLIASFLFNSLGLSAMSWLVNQFQTVWVVAFVILFQPEIKKIIDSCWANKIFSGYFHDEYYQICRGSCRIISNFI